jgi:transcriptional regulator with XRE-family HTH domain
MQLCEVLKNKAEKRGIPIAELARRAGGINPDLLSKALRGKREPRATEFINLCRELELSLEDFYNKGTK